MVARGSLHDGLAFVDGERDRFFAVDVFAGLHGVDRETRMPAVAGRDIEGVDVLACEKITEVAVGRAVCVAVKSVDRGLGAFAPFAHRIADRKHAGAGLVQENRYHLRGAAAAADDAQRDGGRRCCRVRTPNGGAGDGGERSGAQQESTPVD